jgi:hypothetical protein
MLLITGIPQHPQKVFIARNTPAVFRRTCPFALDAN